MNYMRYNDLSYTDCTLAENLLTG